MLNKKTIKKKCETLYQKYICSKRMMVCFRKLDLISQQNHIEVLEEWQQKKKIYKGTAYILGENKFYYICTTFSLSHVWLMIYNILPEFSKSAPSLYHSLWWAFATLVILFSSFEGCRWVLVHCIKTLLKKIKIIK
jgi:hypothetical protein